MRKLALILAVAVAAALVLTPGIAFANFAIHGGYTDDTDACAGCHRAHTSVSSITWSDGFGNSHSALLVSSATQIYQFCYACHGNDAQGAETNVEGGIYKGTNYGTQNAALNGGFTGDTNFMGAIKTSDHIIAGSWGAYGGGVYGETTVGATGDVIGQQVGAGATIPMTCASCHDPHGSSNYRLLADQVYGNVVGGYADDDHPTPYVTSNETGYPDGTIGDLTVGWKKHENGHEQMAGGGLWPGYTPNYTKPLYAKAPTSTASPGGDKLKGMSGWCVGCHSVYMETGTPHTSYESTYNAGDGWGYVPRHRHPMNVDLSAGAGTTKALAATITPAEVPLPLAHAATESAAAATNTVDDWIDCLTCHRAHGTSVTMTGYANIADPTNIEPNTGSGGVPPTGDSALLRLNNRGVCEVCHNK